MRMLRWLAALATGSFLLVCTFTIGPGAGFAQQDPTPPAAELGEDEAANIALEANPDTEVVEVESEQEDGRLLYEVQLSNGVEVEIDATTGEIVETEQGDDEDGEEDDADGGDAGAEQDFTDEFYLDGCDWASTGGNAFFRLEPGLQSVLRGEEDGETVEAIVTVLDETETVAGVETRVVEERESVGGELVEVSRNYFAVCTQTGSVFYFGEDVEDYEDGQVVSSEGAWRAGEGESRPGLIMPAQPLVGARWYTEIAPDVAVDRTEIVELPLEANVPAGTFAGCFRAVDTNPLEPGEADEKVYCPEVGLVQDESLELVYVGPAEDAPPAATPVGS